MCYLKRLVLTFKCCTPLSPKRFKIAMNRFVVHDASNKEPRLMSLTHVWTVLGPKLQWFLKSTVSFPVNTKLTWQQASLHLFTYTDTTFTSRNTLPQQFCSPIVFKSAFWLLNIKL